MQFNAVKLPVLEPIRNQYGDRSFVSVCTKIRPYIAWLDTLDPLEHRDYEGVATYFKLPYHEISNMGNQAYNILIRKDVTVGQLLDCLLHLRRYDILENRDFLLSLEATCEPPIQVPVVSGDLERPDVPRVYDAYICYAQTDLGFAKLIADTLESPPHEFQFFLPDRDRLNTTTSQMAELISKNCRKMIVILSRSFATDRSLEFYLQYSAVLAFEDLRIRVIPIICDDLPPRDIPEILRVLYALQYNQPHLPREWFWNRLIQALRSESRSR